MSNALKSYQLEIFGTRYTLLSDEPEDHLVSSAQLVDTYMKEVAQGSKGKETQKLAILVALRMASELLYERNTCTDTQRRILSVIELINREVVEVQATVPSCILE